ncbi:MAG: 1-deoxy-D-xylulose-5-phosphate synthase [Firmicutes bacterium]|nr:1-deoxy-D-xylulose-5-phosphate synthase [Bacillota bacterium]
MGYLEKINSPKDLKKLDMNALKLLADEIRGFLVDSVSKTGGHLSSSLGVVELTLALHYCFNCPRDKFVWDVGHQAYVHKLLTGRKEGFKTLRRLDGMSGFPRPSESECDAFNAGHSSASISAALGIANARDLKSESFNVVAVIGDGAMSGGMAYEAMNNAGQLKTKMLIVLNDNQMSISPNVGAMSNYLNQLRLAPKYLSAKKDVQKTLKKVPVIGDGVYNFLGRTKEGIKHSVLPSVMFEQLGLTYIGPVDGHDVKKLIQIINRIKKLDEPVLLHVVTKKGKGYAPAEKNPSKFHGIGPFDPETGEVLSKSGGVTYSKVFGKKLVQLAAKHKEICAITAAMPSGTGLEQFAQEFPQRFFDVGIAEEHAVTFAGGLAKGGCLPVFAVYSTFLQRAYDQLIHDICIQKLPFIVAVDRAGVVGDDGETHQGIFDVSFLNTIPNMTVMAPKNKTELEDMLEFAVEQRIPAAIRYPRGRASEILNNAQSPIEYGKSEYIYDGADVALVGFGAVMDQLIGVYAMLIKDGLKPTLVNARFSSPLDINMARDLYKNYKYVFTAEDNVLRGGFGSVMAQAFAGMDGDGARLYSFGFPDCFVEHGTKAQLYKRYGLDAESMYKKIGETMGL